MKKIIISFSMLLIAFSSTLRAQNVVHDANAEVRNVGDFNKIRVSNAITLYLSQGSTEAVAVSAGDKEHTAKIKTEVNNGVLRIYVENGAWNGWNWSDKHLKAYVTFKDLQMLEASGASDVQLVDPISVSDFELELSGASDIKGSIKGNDIKVEVSGASDAKVDITGTSFKIGVAGASDIKGKLTAEKMNFDLSGASTADVQGSTSEFDIVSSGSSNFKGYDMQVVNCKAEASGSSNINIFVSKNLDARASGASNIHYDGSGVITNMDVSGSSNVKKKG